MFLTFTPKALEKIEKKLMPETKLVLDFDDGVGPFSNSATCAMDQAFSLVLCTIDDLSHDFDTVIESNLGFVYVKGYAKTQLDEQMTLDVDRYMLYTLRGNSGILDPNVTLRDMQLA